MNRRNVLKGLAGASISSLGLAFGSGAFTQTEADRTFGINFASDQEAQLAIEANDTSAAITTGENNTVELRLTDLNVDARTEYADALTVRNQNQTDRPIFLYVPGVRGGDGQIPPFPLTIIADSPINAPDNELHGRRDILEPPSTGGKTGAQVIPRQSSEIGNDINITIIVDTTNVLSGVDTFEGEWTLPFVAQRAEVETISEFDSRENFPDDDEWDREIPVL